MSSEGAGHRDWRNVRKNNIHNTAKEPEKPTTTILHLVTYSRHPDTVFLCIFCMTCIQLPGANMVCTPGPLQSSSGLQPFPNRRPIEVVWYACRGGGAHAHVHATFRGCSCICALTGVEHAYAHVCDSTWEATVHACAQLVFLQVLYTNVKDLEEKKFLSLLHQGQRISSVLNVPCQDI